MTTTSVMTALTSSPQSAGTCDRDRVISGRILDSPPERRRAMGGLAPAIREPPYAERALRWFCSTVTTFISLRVSRHHRLDVGSSHNGTCSNLALRPDCWITGAGRNGDVLLPPSPSPISCAAAAIASTERAATRDMLKSDPDAQLLVYHHQRGPHS